MQATRPKNYTGKTRRESVSIISTLTDMLLNHLLPCRAAAASRVSGSVEREPGKLVYEVALYREAEDDTASIDIEQPVPIGSKLQLRVSIDTRSVWSHVKLLELCLSPSKIDPHARGHVKLVDDG